MIQNNQNRQAKTLWTENREGDKITYYRAQSETDEAILSFAELKQRSLIIIANMVILRFCTEPMRSRGRLKKRL